MVEKAQLCEKWFPTKVENDPQDKPDPYGVPALWTPLQAGHSKVQDGTRQSNKPQTQTLNNSGDGETEGADSIPERKWRITERERPWRSEVGLKAAGGLHSQSDSLFCWPPDINEEPWRSGQRLKTLVPTTHKNIFNHTYNAFSTFWGKKCWFNAGILHFKGAMPWKTIFMSFQVYHTVYSSL